MQISTEQDYDEFLISNKQNRIKRVDPFINKSTPIKHECQDKKCGRIWKPKPTQMLDDDYYCPSCVLHHRNNMERFNDDRLKWTKNIPNTFYVFEITDPSNKELKLVKFGRTQHKSSLKRYPNNELKNYNMKLICELRGSLITMTRIENFWKTMASELNIYHNFSVDNFHGKSECIYADIYLKKLLDATELIYKDDNKNADDNGIQFWIE